MIFTVKPPKLGLSIHYAAILAADQFKHRDLRRSAHTHGSGDSADAAVDVELPAGLLEQAGHIRGDDAAGREFRADELKGELAAMGVAGQAQIDA